MSTTTDIPRRHSPWLAVPVAGFAAALGGVVVIWFAGLAALLLVFEPLTDVTIIGPDRARASAIEQSDVKILSSGKGFTTVVGQRAGFVRALYAGGAWLVLPALGRGCGPQPSSRRFNVATR